MSPRGKMKNISIRSADSVNCFICIIQKRKHMRLFVEFRRRRALEHCQNAKNKIYQLEMISQCREDVEEVGVCSKCRNVFRKLIHKIFIGSIPQTTILLYDPDCTVSGFCSLYTNYLTSRRSKCNTA